MSTAHTADHFLGISTSAVHAVRTYPKGVELFSQRRLVDEVLFIHSGWVKLARIDRDGQERILELALAGAWLGTAAVVANEPSPLSAVTCTPTRVTGIPADAFRRSLQHDPALSLQFHQIHARELCRQSGWLLQLSSLTSRQRLERIIRQFIITLHLQASEQGIRINIPLRQRELAQLVAVTPEHLNRLLKVMQDEGVVKRENGWVVIPEIQRLCPDYEQGDAPWCQTSPLQAGENSLAAFSTMRCSTRHAT